MSNVTLDIGGRSYTVACGDGEEAHISMLGRAIEEKIVSVGGPVGQNEPRLLLFAALLLADEVHELKQSGSHGSPAPAALPLEEPDLSYLSGLEELANRLENLAETLERQPVAS